MNRETAKKEYDKIMNDLVHEHIAIEAKAKKDGTWKMGLDSNNALFKEADNAAKRKIEVLITMIDE